jgi:hypothetical protein
MDIDDLLGPAPKKAKPNKVADLLGKRDYRALREPKNPQEGGIFALRKAKGKDLGVTCLICNVKLRHARGRPPVICRKSLCFRAYRNAYRLDYDVVRA